VKEKATSLFDIAPFGVMVPRVGVEGAKLHPAQTQFGCRVTVEATNISSDL